MLFKDTAAVYRNEAIIGKIISDVSSYNLNRSDIFITTKLSPADQGRGKCKQAILDSLERLKLSYIDLVLIHFPGSSRSTPNSPKNPENRRGSWEDLEELQNSGIVKNIGVSNYTIRHLQELFGYAKIKPVVNQVGNFGNKNQYIKHLYRIDRSTSIVLSKGIDQFL